MLPDRLLGAVVRAGALGPPPPSPVVDRSGPRGGMHLVAGPGSAVVEVERVGAFGIDDGQVVVVDAIEGADADLLDVWLHGTVAALVLGQQGRFALHASTVVVAGSAVALLGPRGAGKSTTALELHRRGGQLVTDDVSPVDGAPATVTPFGRPLHLDAATATRVGLDPAAARYGLPDGKLAFAAPAAAPTRLDAVIRLDPTGALPARRIPGRAAVEVLLAETYRARLVRQLWPQAHFRWATALAAAVPVHAVSRPSGAWTVDAVADAIEAIVASGLPPSAPWTAPPARTIGPCGP